MPLKQPNIVCIGVERLESRFVPVIGLTGPGTPVALGDLGGDYDGVVKFTHDDGTGKGKFVTSGTGSILTSPGYILTAAHVIGDWDGTIRPSDGQGGVRFPEMKLEFEHRRAGGNAGVITVRVPPGPDHQSVHPSWDSRPGRRISHDDIGLVTLPDQTDFSSKRVMIAPYRSTHFGGNRYEVFTGPPTGQRFSMVGYGEVGKGPDGNNTDRVDRVTIANPLPSFPAFRNEFTITVGGVGVPAATTARIRQLATAEEVAAALDTAAGKGNYVVNTKGLPAGTWDIRSVGSREDANHGGGVTQIDRYDAGMAKVTLTPNNRWPGGFAGGIKRSGENEFDSIGGHPTIVEYDFDDPAANLNAKYNSTGLAGVEAGIGRGDSGGPGLVRVAGVPQVLGVVSYFAAGLGANDATEYVYGSGAPGPDSSIGETGGYTHVNPYMTDYINKKFINEPADWLLDMNYQTYGTSAAGEKLDISVRNVNGFLEIAVISKIGVNPGDAELDGVYARLKASSVKSLILRGTDDDETFRIIGDLGITGNVYVEGTAGSDEFIYDDTAAPALRHDYTLAKNADPGYDLRLSRAIGGAQYPVPSAIDVKNVNKYTLLTSPGNDIVGIEAAPAALTRGLFVVGGPGSDDIYVGSVAKGMADLAANVFADGESGANQNASNGLHYRDQVPGGNHRYVMGFPEAKYLPPNTPAWQLRFERVGVPATYSKGFSYYEVQAGFGNNEVRLDATVATTWVDDSIGDDTVQVGSDADGLRYIGGWVAVYGTVGLDHLIVNDELGVPTANAKYDVGKGFIERVGGPLVTNFYPMARTLKGAAGGNQIRLLGNLMDSEAVLTIKSGAGTDTVTVSDLNNKFDDILGSITVDGMTATGTAKDKIVFGDTGYNQGATYTVRPNQTTTARMTAFTLTHTGFEAIDMNAGAGHDTVELDGTFSGILLTVDGGDETLNGANAYDQVHIKAGAVTDPVFRWLERLNILGGVLTLNTAPPAFKDVKQTAGTLDGTATLTALNTLEWTGGTMQGTGTTSAAAGSQVTFDGGVKTLLLRLVDLAGTTTWTAGDILGGTGRVLNREGGTFNGAGKFDGQGFTNAGVVSIRGRGAIGVLNIVGNYTQTAGGILEIEFRAAAAGVWEHDQLVVGGTNTRVTLAGSLRVLAPSTFIPPDGTKYTVVRNDTGSAVVGTFDNGVQFIVGGVVVEISYNRPPPRTWTT